MEYPVSPALVDLLNRQKVRGKAAGTADQRGDKKAAGGYGSAVPQVSADREVNSGGIRLAWVNTAAIAKSARKQAPFPMIEGGRK